MVQEVDSKVVDAEVHEADVVDDFQVVEATTHRILT